MFLPSYLEKKLLQISLSTSFVLGIAHNVNAEPYGTGGYGSCQYGQACDGGSLTSTGVNFIMISSLAAIIVAGIIFYFLYRRRKNKENQPANANTE